MSLPPSTPAVHARRRYDSGWPVDIGRKPAVLVGELDFVLTVVIASYLNNELQSRSRRIQRRTGNWPANSHIIEDLADRFGSTTYRIDQLIKGRRWPDLAETARFVEDPSLGREIRSRLAQRQVLYDAPADREELVSTVNRLRLQIMDSQKGEAVMSIEDQEHQLQQVSNAIVQLTGLASAMQNGIARERARDDRSSDERWIGQVDWSDVNEKIRDGIALTPAPVGGRYDTVPFAVHLRRAMPHSPVTTKDLRRLVGEEILESYSTNILHSTLEVMVKRGELRRVDVATYARTAQFGKRRPRTSAASS